MWAGVALHVDKVHDDSPNKQPPRTFIPHCTDTTLQHALLCVDGGTRIMSTALRLGYARHTGVGFHPCRSVLSGATLTLEEERWTTTSRRCRLHGRALRPLCRWCCQAKARVLQPTNAMVQVGHHVLTVPATCGHGLGCGSESKEYTR